MAIQIGNETLDVQKEERTYCVEILTDKNTDPVIRARREELWVLSDGTIINRNRNIPVVERRLSEILNKTVLGLSGLQLAGIIAAWADDLRQEDIQNPPIQRPLT